MSNLTKLSSAAILAFMIGFSAPAFSCDNPDCKDHVHKECDLAKDKNCKDDHHNEKSHSDSKHKDDHDHKDGDDHKTTEKPKNN